MKEYFMKEALNEAKKALEKKEVPVGAIIVKDDKIISRAHNLKEVLNDATAHAEILAIRKASEFLGQWRLNGCNMYVTLEPCPMCAGAILQARISKLYIGTFDPTAGACGSVVNLIDDNRLKSKIAINWMYDDESTKIIDKFFKELREV